MRIKIEPKYSTEFNGYVFNNPDNPKTMPIHCVNCGHTLMVIKGTIYSWSIGDGHPFNQTEITTNYISHVCTHCKYKHNILIQNNVSDNINQ